MGKFIVEDNAEFGLGLRLATNKKTERAYMLLSELKDQIGADLYDKLVSNPQKLMQTRNCNGRILKN